MPLKLVFRHMFVYNLLKMSTYKVLNEEDTPLIHPAETWLQDAKHPSPPRQLLQLRLAAMAGHMRLDPIAARRAALIDLLADGRPHPRDEIWQTVAAQLGYDCWGKLPQESLARDIKALRRGQMHIAYSRRPGAVGYYLAYPPITRPATQLYEEINWQRVQNLRRLTTEEKNRQAFAAADFALRQKRLLLAEKNPDWTKAEIDKEARRQLFGNIPELD